MADSVHVRNELFLRNNAVTIRRVSSWAGPLYWEYQYQFATGERRTEQLLKGSACEEIVRHFAAECEAAVQRDLEAQRRRYL